MDHRSPAFSIFQHIGRALAEPLVRADVGQGGARDGMSGEVL